MRVAGGALALALAGAACSRGGDAAADAPFRHVLLISLDTTRADHLGCYGDRRALTPAIDVIASDGIVFESALAPAPTTLASHTSMMTGTWPHTHGVVRNGFVVNEANEMLAEVLARAGFHAAGFIGSFALERRFGFAQGFDWYDERFDEAADFSAGVDQNQRRADAVVDAALRHVDELDGERMFLFLHFFDAHSPYDPPPPWNARFVQPGRSPTWSVELQNRLIAMHHLDYMPEPIGLDGVSRDGMPLALVDGEHMRPRPADLDLAALYAGEIAYVDSQLGRLLAELERRGVLRDALVVVTADHGETFFEHGDYWSHGSWVYDTTVHVPLILRFPDRRGAGRRVAEPVSTVDLAPTLLDLLGIERPERMEGSSLRAAIDGGALARGPVFSQATKPGPRHEPPGRWGNLLKARCVREGRYKYVVAPYLGGKEQLFDLVEDRWEQHDLLRGALPPELAPMRERLRGMLDAWVREEAGLPSRYEDVFAEETQRKLDALGYGYGGDEGGDGGGAGGGDDDGG